MVGCAGEPGQRRGRRVRHPDRPAGLPYPGAAGGHHGPDRPDVPAVCGVHRRAGHRRLDRRGRRGARGHPPDDHVRAGLHRVPDAAGDADRWPDAGQAGDGVTGGPRRRRPDPVPPRADPGARRDRAGVAGASAGTGDLGGQPLDDAGQPAGQATGRPDGRHHRHPRTDAGELGLGTGDASAAGQLGRDAGPDRAGRRTGAPPPAPPGTPGWAYLAAVLAERNRRSVRRLAQARAATATVWPELAREVHRTGWVLPPVAPPPPLPPGSYPPGGPVQPGLVRPAAPATLRGGRHLD